MGRSWMVRCGPMLLLLALVIGILPVKAQEHQQEQERQEPQLRLPGPARQSAPSTSEPAAAPPARTDEAEAPLQPPPPPAIRVTGTRSVYSQEEVEQAVAALRAYCQPLGGEQWGDLNDITARITPEYAPYRREKGWITAIHLTANISNKPRHIPGSDPQMGSIAGRTLYFFIGGGREPGVFVSRQTGQFLCGLPAYESGDVEFIPIPELEFLNR